jgi:uncharacterized membrane protein
MAAFLMLRTIIGYTSFKTDIQFLALKQDYIDNSVWKTAFYIHTFSAVFTLFAGFTQFSEQFLKDFRRWHKILGRMYVWNVLLINAPTGFIMAIYANGGWMGKSAFLTLDILWFYFTLKAFTTALNGKFDEHRDYMIRSYALTFSAISLRSWKIIMTYTGWVDMAYIYIVDAWLALIVNLLVSEWIVRRNKVSDRKSIASQA